MQLSYFHQTSVLNAPLCPCVRQWRFTGKTANMAWKEETRVQLFWIIIFISVLCLWNKSASAAKVNPPANCPTTCGNISVPFPFGIGDDCSRDGNFNVYCNETASPPTAYLFSNSSNIEILSVSVTTGELRFFKSTAYACYNSSNDLIDSNDGWINIEGSPNYKFSDKRNKFTVVGCNALAFINGEGSSSYLSGCASVCLSEENVEEGPCSGLGCCQTTIPKGLNYYNASFTSFTNLAAVRAFNPCSYAFVAEEGSYNFKKSDLNYSFLDDNRRGIPMVLDWVVGTESCKEARLNSSSYACVSANSTCVEIGRSGYVCHCTKGYEGNPYLVGGCQDIDECTQRNDICSGGRTCINVKGDYKCECPEGSEYDEKTGSCARKRSFALPLALGLSTGTFLLIILGSCSYWGFYKRKILLSRKNFFEQNGGLLLKRHVSQHSGSSFGIYSEKQMEKATDNFKQVLGQGGQGTVYKGILGDGEVVAIKKSRTIAESQRSEFAKEMMILSQINHRHVVKLQGCCLEVDIPMLVYEFVSGGTLFRRLHGPEKHNLHFLQRLTIAIQSASALNYLHAEASPPIVHGDVKTANILLDDKSGAKISDFGASKLAPMDKDMFATVVQGTYGYLDPESLQTYQLTEKSDVYSFGVVLAELITRRTPLYEDDMKTQRTLALEIVTSEKNGQLMEFLDQLIANEANLPYLESMAQLACRCLRMKGDERPSMKVVMTELEAIEIQVLATGHAKNVNEEEPLLGHQNAWDENNPTTSSVWEKSAASIRGR